MALQKKILLHRLPRAVEDALTEQFAHLSCAVATEAGSAETYDVVISAADADFPGCPVLKLAPGAALRLGAVLRQVHQMLQEPVLYLGDIAVGPYVFRPQEKILMEKSGDEIALTDREAVLLAYLARRRGETVGRDELLKSVWRYQENVDTHTLETHIYRLRQKMGGAQDMLATEAGGYSLRAAP